VAASPLLSDGPFSWRDLRNRWKIGKQCRRVGQHPNRDCARYRMVSYHSLAPLNSALNATAAILLIAGYYCIRRRWVRAHRLFMLSAVAVSAAFFISYSVYHLHVGDVRFQGRGWMRPVYFTILISHVFLAAAIVPLVLVTLWRALNRNFRRHRRIALWTWPIWIYVSITGVIVYLMCYQLYTPGYSQPVSAPALRNSSGKQAATLVQSGSKAAPGSGSNGSGLEIL
jgi:putative membrane protein